MANHLTEQIRQAALAVLARKSLLDCAQIVRPSYKANWHHKILIDHIEALARRDIRRLLVMMPPGHGKSELVSRILPAWYALNYPDHNIIAASHTYGLAVTMSLDAKNIMASERYVTLPKALGLGITKPEANKAKDTEHFWQIPFGRGKYLAAGVRKGITGHRFDLGIIDDPIKDASDAYSPVIRQLIWDWYTQTFSTRQAQNAVQLITHTRWHPDDLAGRILEKEYSQWTVLELPALFELPGSELDHRIETGQALWPEMYSREDLEHQRLLLGEAAFDALYQQRPTLPSSNLFASMFRPMVNVKPLEFDPREALLLSFDFNVDPLTCLIGQRIGNRIHVLDEVTVGPADVFEFLEVIADRLQPYGDANIMVTGDTNGYSRNSFSKGLQNFYQLAANRIGFRHSMIRTPRSNPTHIASRAHTNLLLQLGRIQIDPKCTGLIYDMQHVQINEAGGIVKENRASRAQRADLLDAGRYLWNTFLPISSIPKSELQPIQSESD